MELTKQYLEKAFRFSVRWFLKLEVKMTKGKAAKKDFLEKCDGIKDRLPRYTPAQIHRQMILMGLYCLIRAHGLEGMPHDYYPYHSRRYVEKLMEQKEKERRASYQSYWSAVTAREK